jgi:hypothetical protein
MEQVKQLTLLKQLLFVLVDILNLQTPTELKQRNMMVLLGLNKMICQLV